MGNKAVGIPFIVVVALLGAAFLFSAVPAHAAERTSVARGVMDMVTQRLCDRQAAMSGRLPISIIHPSKCVTTPPPAEPTVTLTASPSTITQGATATLTWTSTNASTCTASGDWSGTKAPSGSASVTPSETSEYVLTCTGAGGSDSDDATVTVTAVEPEDPTLDLAASDTSIMEGESVTLSWTTSNAATCEKSGGWSGSTTTSGMLSVSPTATTTYSMECTGAGGSITDSVTVNVTLMPEDEPDAPTVNLTAAPTSVTPGAGSATTTLSWTSTDATACTASGDPFTGSKALNGTEIITPTATTTFVLTCTGAGGSANDSVVVNFVPTPATPEPEPTVDHLLISEVYYDVGGVHGTESSAASANEWLELYNPTNASVDLTNWWIQDATTLDKIPDGTTIPAGGKIVIAGTSTTSGFWGNTPMIVLGSAIGGGLANGADALSLINANGATTTVDALSWGTDTSVFASPVTVSGDDNSLARASLSVDTDTAADWMILADPTPGN